MQWRVSSDDCVNMQTGEECVFVNVVPEQYAGEAMHELHPDCWCEPEMEGQIVTHRVVQ